MTAAEEREFHRVAQQLADLTKATGWTAMQYAAVARLLKHLTEYCRVD